ncbi:Uncharacterised protein [Mycobacteroides abscessus subsp. abscessus]|nr:Uncharacterised protein [Mycobacteroides abscessus subsp. abscessus]
MARKTIAQLEAENALLRADLETAGKLFNQAAEDNNLCVEYDETIERVNEELKSGFQFTPRGEDQDIRVTLVASMDVELKVLARDRYGAQDKVDDMPDRDVFALAGHGDLFDTLKAAGFDFSVER